MPSLRILWVSLLLVPVACGGSTSEQRSGSLDHGGRDAGGRAPDASRGAPDASRGAPDAGRSNGVDGGSPNVSIEGGNPVTDPHATERHQLVSDFCAILDQYPCLKTEHTGGDCREIFEEMQYWETPEECWNEWASAVRCLTTAPRQCPCSGTAMGSDCYIDDLTPTSTGPCIDERQNLARCKGAHPGAGDVQGTLLECNWTLSPTKTNCAIMCLGDPNHQITATCLGAPSGPFGCTVYLNGREIVDDATGDTATFDTTDCPGAAKTVGDGFGSNFVNCCFDWVKKTDSGTSESVCTCTADPSQEVNGRKGYATCAEAAAAGNGQIVDLCPRYLDESSPGLP